MDKKTRDKLHDSIRMIEISIASKLKALELESGMLVDAIEIRDVDITNFDDDRKVLKRRVMIHLKQMPGHNWDC